MKKADFYLCTSSAEGLNLPLLKAMMIGKPIISTWCTAMKSYLSATCSIEIDCEEKIVKDGNPLLQYQNLTHFPPKQKSITDAIMKASKLTNKEKLLLGENAKKTAISFFGINSFTKNFSKIVNYYG